MKVSVIIPTFNRKNLLARAISSVRAQNFQEYELIVVDDGSSDLTSSLDMTNINYIRLEENYGVSKARNIACSAAQGDWLAFLDSDDEWLPTHLDNCIEFIARNKEVHIVASEEIIIRRSVKVENKTCINPKISDYYISSLSQTSRSCSTLFVKREKFKEIGGFDESLPVCEDYDLWLRFAALYQVGLTNKETVLKYLGHSDQLSSKFQLLDKYRIMSMIKILKEYKLSRIRFDHTFAEIEKKANILMQNYQMNSNHDGEQELSNMLQDFKIPKMDE